MLEAQRLSIHVASTSSLYARPDFLSSLEAQTVPSYQVIQVELGSSPSDAAFSREMVRPELVRLRTFRNVGVVRGQNQALALALTRWPKSNWGERFVVITRPEVAFDSGACEVLLRAFDQDPTLMIAGPKVFWGETAVHADGDWLELTGTDELYAAGIGLSRGRVLHFLGRGQTDTGAWNGGDGVFLLSDACVVIRASALERLSLSEHVWLDPRLPHFFAVLDLCWRAAYQGMRPQLVSAARVWFAPQDESRHTPQMWRERYVPAALRRADDVALRAIHAPWLAGSYLRYRVSRLFSGKFWDERIRPELGAAGSPSDVKLTRRPDRAVPFAERRAWFLS